MDDIPKAFCVRIAGHNRHCWLTAATTTLGAALTWTVLAGLYTAAVLLFETIRTGDTNLQGPPQWFFPLGAGLVLLLFLWALIDRWMRLYKGPSDRQIIGWHLIPDVLLFPARMVFSIADHLGARIVLSRFERREAWRLLRAIWEMEHASTAFLAYEFPDARLLRKLLPALQLAGWIDMHGDNDDWYYRVCSDEEPAMREMLPSKPPIEE